MSSTVNVVSPPTFLQGSPEPSFCRFPLSACREYSFVALKRWVFVFWFINVVVPYKVPGLGVVQPGSLLLRHRRSGFWKTAVSLNLKSRVLMVAEGGERN